MDRQERADLLCRVRRDARLITDHFGLEYRDILAEHPRVKSRYGVCYQDGLIKIRLNHARTGEPLKYSSLIDTLCHELAHLKHFDHGPQFKAFFFRLLGWARSRGIYQPGPGSGRRQPGPAARPRPSLGGPPRRNGVPVFPSETEANLALPWMVQLSGQPVSRPAVRSTDPHRRGLDPPSPRQLELF